MAAGLPLPQTALSSLAELRSDYTSEVSRWLVRFLAPHARGNELDDIIGRESTELCEKLDATMTAYPDPRAYALTRTYGQRAVLDWRRRERVQRCEGAEIAFDDHGHRTKGNYVDSFDTVALRNDNDDVVTLYDLFVAEAFDLEIAVDEMVLDRIDRAAFMADVRTAALGLLTESERRALELVVERGLQVIEAAAEAGVTRETMGRQRDRAIDKIRGAFVARR